MQTLHQNLAKELPADFKIRAHLGLEKEPSIERPISYQRTSSAQLVELPLLGGFYHRYEWKEAE